MVFRVRVKEMWCCGSFELKWSGSDVHRVQDPRSLSLMNEFDKYRIKDQKRFIGPVKVKDVKTQTFSVSWDLKGKLNATDSVKQNNI